MGSIKLIFYTNYINIIKKVSKKMRLARIEFVASRKELGLSIFNRSINGNRSSVEYSSVRYLKIDKIR